MWLHDKMEKSMEILHERSDEGRGMKTKEGLDVEKGDVLAMVISAFLVIVPAVALVLAAMVGLSYLAMLH